MFWFATAHGLKFRSSGTLVADEVGISAAESGWTHRFVRIDHQVVFGCLCHAIQIMVVHPLIVMVASVREYIADVAALDDVVSVVASELVGILQLSFVIDNG